MIRTHAFHALMLTLMLAAVQLIHYYPQLPQTVASHFDHTGQADDWMSKPGFAIFYATLIAFIGLFFIGLAAVIPTLPDSLITLPNKQHWLAPEQRETTLKEISRQLLWFGATTILFFIVNLHLTIRVSLGLQSGLGTIFWILLIAFLFITIFWCLRLYLKFKRTPEEEPVHST